MCRPNILPCEPPRPHPPHNHYCWAKYSLFYTSVFGFPCLSVGPKFSHHWTASRSIGPKALLSRSVKILLNLESVFQFPPALCQIEKEILITHSSVSTLQYGWWSSSHSNSTALCFVSSKIKFNSFNFWFVLKTLTSCMLQDTVKCKFSNLKVQ